MADDDKKQSAPQQNQNRAQASDKGQLKGFSNDPDKRSPEQQQEDIAKHNERMNEFNSNALNERLEAFDQEKLGYRGLGGMDIIDTRNAQPRFQPLSNVADANLAAKKQLGEENRNVQATATDREEQQARNQRRDPTARAEVDARR